MNESEHELAAIVACDENRKRIIDQITKLAIIPVVVLNDATDAEPVARALCKGGLPAAEVTFRTAAAEESIRIMSEKFPEMLVGAGTVLTTEQVDQAVKAGAKFIVSPGFNPNVVKYCISKKIPVVPGCNNPSVMEAAMELGLDVVKFFPAEASGGIKAIKAMAAPYVNLRFMPTGGINAANINDYLSFKKIIACGGSWMVSGDLVNNKEFDKIEELTKEAVMKVHGFELKHIGINCNSEEEALNTTSSFEKLFGFTQKNGGSSVFAGTFIEAMKTPYLGTKGHIAVGCNNIERAIAYLEAIGTNVDMSTAKYDAQNCLKAVYLPNEISGFAVHLVQK